MQNLMSDTCVKTPINCKDRITHKVCGPVGYRGKRLFDIIGASILLLLCPVVVLPLAVVIGMTSPGSVIFRQKRVGMNGKIFTCFKLRTMYLNDSSDIDTTYPGDPRITPVGKFIRKFSLDELPQLVNVIFGEMSLVGPRPHMLTQDKYFEDILPGYTLRRQVRPGITGLAQVNGFRGPTDEPWQKVGRLKNDLKYIETMSAVTDFKILFRTIGVVFQ